MANSSAIVTVFVDHPFVDLNAPVILTSRLSGSLGRPTGAVSFRVGNLLLGSVPVDADGMARFTTSTLLAGAYEITASYSGDANYAPAVSSAAALLVGAAAAPTADAGIPVVTVNLAAGPTPSYTEGAAAVSLVPSATAVSLSYGNSQALSSATVEITQGFTSGDKLSVNTAGTALTAQYDPTKGRLALVGQADDKTYKQVLATLKFSHDGIAPTALSAQRSVSVSVSNSGDGV